MREQIIRKYIETDHIYDIIWHDMRRFVETAVKYCLFLFVLWVIYVYGISILQQPLLQTIWAVLGIIVYVKMMYDIFDEYLDSLVITDKGIIHFRRDGLWKQKAEMLSRVSIESVSHEQNSFWDSVIGKWDIRIKLEDVITRFDDVSDPAVVSNKILEYKDRILWRHNYMENEVSHEPDKYNILIEALGEVVTEYVEKKKGNEYY